jgi:hypothetical protein
MKNCEQNASSLTFDLSNLLIRRIQEKGANISENREDVKKEVLSKLKKLCHRGKSSKVWRAQSANFNPKIDMNLSKNEENNKKRGLYYFNEQPYIGK